MVSEKINEWGDRTEELSQNATQTGEMGNMIEEYEL